MIFLTVPGISREYMRLFFVEPGSVADTLATLSGSESRHIYSVLRLAPETEVELFDGTGILYQGRLETVSRREVTVRIRSCHKPADHSTRPLTLTQGILKGKKMDFLVQKATELGVHSLQPLLCRYSDIQRVSPRQQDRWRRIMLEACKQCRRAVPMTILEPVRPEDQDCSPFASRILFWEEEPDASMTADLLQPSGSICLVFGPEGGLHKDEVNGYRHAGFSTVSLGPQILRAETAALAGTAIVRFLAGGLKPSRSRITRPG